MVEIKLAHELPPQKQAPAAPTSEKQGRRERRRTAAALVPGRGGRVENDERLVVASGGSSLFPRERRRPARFSCWIDPSVAPGWRAIQLVSLCAGAPGRYYWQGMRSRNALL